MLSKFLFIVGVIAVFGFGALYFVYNSSYQDSFEARFYYFIGNYEKAYTLSKRAYEKDSYNKMAFTVFTQSKIALNYEEYIKEGNKYLGKIEKISSSDVYNQADKVRVKMMCEIMIDRYKRLTPTKLTDKSLLENSKKIYMKFKKLYDELYGH